MNKVEIKNLTLKKDNTVIYDKLNLNICGGTYTTIIGPSSSGKTTLFNTIIKGNKAIKVNGNVNYVVTNPDKQIVGRTVEKQIKFIKQSKACPWREPMPAVNLLSTSTCWRQDHNGFTHQSPALISTLLSHPSDLCNCIFPVDDVAAEEAFHFMLGSRDVVNLTTFNKNPLPRYIDSHHAKYLFDNGGASIYQFASDEKPDIIFTAAGDIVTHEALEAIKILREDLPRLKMRFVGINALSYRAIGTTENKLSKEKFDEMFLKHIPIIANFHGYPETLENILENYTERRRLRVHGFNEEGSTTTPFEMLRRNGASRYDIAIDVAEVLGQDKLVEKYRDILESNHEHAVQFGEDLIK